MKAWQECYVVRKGANFELNISFLSYSFTQGKQNKNTWISAQILGYRSENWMVNMDGVLKGCDAPSIYAQQSWGDIIAP